MRRFRLTISRILAAAVCVGCAGRGTRASVAQTTTERRSGGDSARSYAITKAFADSVEQAKVAAFLKEYQSRSVPLQKAGNWFGQIELLRTLRAQSDESNGVRSMSGQLLGTFVSFLGQNQLALAMFDSLSSRSPSPPDTSALVGATAVDAIDAIVAMAETTQVVFVNEAHHDPRHRAFTARLLERLKRAGFTYLAAETLAEADSAINTRRYPSRASGFYSNEPMFGDMLRTALRLGYTLVPYEAMGAASQDARETGQAKNLVDRIFKTNPKARVLVHAGYSHIDESGTLAGAKPMAIRFREMTGIDPLTIDQTLMSEHADTLMEDPRYRAIVAKLAPRTPVVLRKGDALWSAKPGVHDVTVIHPRATYREGRPDWLWAMGGRRRHELPANACAAARECVVTARLASEGEDAVPMDALLVGPGRASRTMLLPPGDYVVTARDAAAAMLSESRVTIRE